MAWTPNIYQDRPDLRDRVFAAVAMGATLIGGAMAMDTIVTGGWQWGATARPAHQRYDDDVDQRWSEPAPSVPAPQPVALATVSAPAASDMPIVSLAGVATPATAQTPPPPPPEAQNQPAQQAPGVDDAATEARFDEIEAEIALAQPPQDADDDGGKG